jgi:LysR family hydrogen peroxide-inducible transcriptional activator
MNLRDLRYIIAIAETLNFSEAAKQCHVSQPTLSAQVKKLEDYLGVVLFERNNKSVLPTEAATEILAAARRAIAEADLMKELAEASRSPFAGRFRLGAFPTLAPYYLPKIVPFIREIFPKLTLMLVEEKTETLLTQLKEGRIDAALLALPIAEESLVTMPLFADAFMLAVPSQHALAGSDGVTLAELVDLPLMLLEEGHCLRAQALEICSLAGTQEMQGFRATSLETLREMVRAGTGVTLMPQMATRKQERGIAYLPFTEDAPERIIALVWRKTTARRSLLEKLVEMIRAIEAQTRSSAA